MFGVVSVHKTMTNSSFIRNPFHNHNHNAVCSPVQFGAVVPSCLVFVCRRHANNFSVLNYTVSHFHRISTPSHPEAEAKWLPSLCLCVPVHELCIAFAGGVRQCGVRSCFYYECGAHRKSHIIINSRTIYYTVWIFAFKSQIIIWINCGIVCAVRGKSVPAVLCVMWSGKRTGQINNHACWMNICLLTVNNQCDSLAHLKF